MVFFERKPASETPWTKKLWIYDLRTNQHFTLKTNPLRREHLDEFVKLYNPANRHERKATWSAEPSTGSGRTGDGSGRTGDGSGRTGDGSGRTGDGSGRAGDGTGQDGRWRAYDYADLMARDKASLDIFWLKDDSLADSDNLLPPNVIAQEIVDDLEAALEQFRLIASDLESNQLSLVE